MQIGDRRAAALTAAHGHIETAEAFLLVAVDVVRERIACLLAGREPRGMQRVREASVAGLQGPPVAAVGVAARIARLSTTEVRQHLGIAPAARALLLPTLEVEGVATHIHHAVDGRGTTQGLATRAVDAPPIHKGLGLGLVLPAIARIGHRIGQG